ncbi:molybdopterin oxidoreductase [Desulfitobacterium hafniense DCB-2]|uniref:Molybdopterin oxidoreductase n=1 Tax=Desulfitobacterium hafniense (strain DSM 10664 / DCB-2) TaxID=272564 RepID=B8FTE5_DESHD|nr:molybdopterin-dependent oxidoreductase [Desulfitobacterium hafniense]ACL20379.1 molybdopterin oxidoreductase [Desulfitobacterium hafniense DCB-2]
MPTFRNTCPRHCYGSCSMISHMSGGKLTRVVGDSEHGYTRGRLCAKGYSLIQYALDEYRLKYPLRQVRRGSGEWRRISWDQAYEIIASKMIELNTRYGSNLGLGYYKGNGNAGLLHQAVEGMFAGLGPHTRPIGDICSATGETALRETVNELRNPDPEKMSDAGLIVIWGANPANTNINQMKFIYEARQKGTPLVVIDPLLTHTANRADLYVQINPGTDAWLAWGIAKLLIESDKIDKEFIRQKTREFHRYKQGLEGITLEEVCSHTGVHLRVVEELADLYARFHPAANWLGFGMQRYPTGGESVKAVSALAALTGSFGSVGGGVYFRHRPQEEFPLHIAKHQGVKQPLLTSSREVPANDFPGRAMKLQEPPLKMLWVSCGNPLAQDYNLRAWRDLFQQMEFIVTVDLYLNSTARQSDLVLPAASFFEEEDLHVSFWHHWLSYNQKVLPAFYEAKSDLQIARELTRKLNELQPGFSNFPAEKEPWDWIAGELSPEIRELYGLEEPADLKRHSYRRKKESLLSGWNYCFSRVQPHLFKDMRETESSLLFPYHLLTPQSLLKFHTQYETLSWLNGENREEPIIELAEEIACKHTIREDSLVEIYNEHGSISGRAKINPYLPEKIILVEQSDRYPINHLISGQGKAGESIPYFDCRVNLRRVRSDV